MKARRRYVAAELPMIGICVIDTDATPIAQVVCQVVHEPHQSNPWGGADVCRERWIARAVSIAAALNAQHELAASINGALRKEGS